MTQYFGVVNTFRPKYCSAQIFQDIFFDPKIFKSPNFSQPISLDQSIFYSKSLELLFFWIYTFSPPKFSRPKSFWTQNFLYQIFLTTIFWTKLFHYQNLTQLSYPKLFWLKKFWTKRNFGRKIFGTKIFWTKNSFGI